jgi:hypothetical protein
LPTTKDPGETGFAPVSPDALRDAGRVKTAEWLDWAEAEWRKARKSVENASLSERLDYIRHLSAQEAQKRFVVIYTAAGSRPVAAVIDTQKLSLPFVARDRMFWGSFSSAAEAHFLAAMLNSDFAAGRILDWMNKGLFGPRDINKRVLDVPWPAFKDGNRDHVRLSTLAKLASSEARKAASSLPDKNAAWQRASVRRSISKETAAEIEKLVETLSGSVKT